MSLAQIGAPNTSTYIYGLIDPRTKGIRYVGKSDSPDNRLKGHLSDKTHNHRTNWIKELTKINLCPVLTIIQTTNKNNWQNAERWWITKFREAGYDLVNGTDGGEGHELTDEAKLKISIAKTGKRYFAGHKHSETSRWKMSEAKKGRKFSKEIRLKMSIAQKGKMLPEETKEKIRKARTGTILSEEARRKISIAQKGKILSAETRKRISDSSKGKKMSSETRNKMSESAKRRWQK